jgi:hypothetical protein
MQYHLETIPVWEAMELKGECPLCALFVKTEREEIDRTLGASVMEPDVRIRFNQAGVCREHQQMLYARQDRLPHALLMDSHVKEQLEALKTLQKRAQADGGGKGGLLGRRRPADPAADTLGQMSAHCVVCDTIDAHMARYRTTFLHLWKTDEHFRAAWQASKGVCLPHLAELMSTEQPRLTPDQRNAFLNEALALLIGQLENDEKDLDWFTRKFDYRNREASWGNSKTAVERAANRLRGWCVGADPFPKKD